MQETSEKTTDEMSLNDASENKYLLFRLSDELYGTPLLSVREVVEPQTVKPVPNTPRHYSGIINLRGQIVGVLNLGELLGIQQLPSSKNDSTKTRAFVVFDTVAGPLAVVVDRIDEVAKISESSIERNPDVQCRYPQEFLLGIGKVKEELTHLIDFSKLLSAGELKQIRQAKKG